MRHAAHYIASHPPNEDDSTGSIMVDVYPPIREMRAEDQGVDPMTDAEIEAFKRRGERLHDSALNPAGTGIRL